MDRISGLNHLIEILRKKISRPATQHVGGSSSHVAKAATRQGQSANDIAQLEERVLDRLRSIDQLDSKSKEKGVHIFVESVLVWELGEELLRDPAFLDLVEDVSTAILADSRFESKFSRLLSSI